MNKTGLVAEISDRTGASKADEIGRASCRDVLFRS